MQVNDKDICLLAFIPVLKCSCSHVVFIVCWQLCEFELALVRRDDVIRTLSADLRTTTENRDSLQAEYMTQASQLVEQVQILQDQLKQVQFLRYTNILGDC